MNILNTSILLGFTFFVHLGAAQNSGEMIKSEKEFMISVAGGYGYRLAPLAASTPPDLVDYSNKLKSGYVLSLDAAWFLDPAWGIGFKLSRFGAAASMGNTVVTFDDGSSAYGTMSDDINITFVGPSYISRYTFTNPDHLLYGGLSLGYIGYRNEFFLINNSMELTGATLGGAVDLGYDYSISKHITIGAQAAVTGGVLSKITMIDGHSETTLELEEENRENLSRIDISAGVRVRI